MDYSFDGDIKLSQFTQNVETYLLTKKRILVYGRQLVSFDGYRLTSSDGYRLITYEV